MSFSVQRKPLANGLKISSTFPAKGEHVHMNENTRLSTPTENIWHFASIFFQEKNNLQFKNYMANEAKSAMHQEQTRTKRQESMSCTHKGC